MERDMTVPGNSLQQGIPITLMRGGTSKGVFIEEKDLPPVGSERDRVLLALMGSPDPMQIDGLGGTHSSTSKVVVVGKSDEPEIDLRYWFAQIGVETAVVDAEGNCGNLTTAVAPYAIDQGLVEAHEPATVLRLRNLNTGTIIESTVNVRDGQPEVQGQLAVPGVPGTGAPVSTKFLNPAGSVLGKALPTGSVLDTIAVSDRDYSVSILDVTHPMAFVDAGDFGLDLGGTRTVDLNNDSALLARMEDLRAACAVTLGVASTVATAASEAPTVPNLVFVQTSNEDNVDLLAIAVSMGKVHHALPVTAALCLAAAARISGTVPNRLSRTVTDTIHIRHPKGVIPVSADIDTSTQTPAIRSVGVVRTARKILTGTAFVPSHTL